MRWRSVLLLWLIAGGLAAQHFLVDRRRPTVHPAERPVRRRLFAPLVAQAVAAVRLERDGTLVALRRYGEDWVVEQPPGGQLPGGLTQAFIEAVAAVEEIQEVGAAPVDAGAAGLGADALRVWVTDRDGRERRLTVGDANAAGTAVYARVDDAGAVVLVGRNLEYYAQLILQEVSRPPEPAGDGPVA